MKAVLKVLIAITAVVVITAISWGIAIGVIKLITMCFGWNFSIKIATGIWLIFMLINFFIKGKE